MSTGAGKRKNNQKDPFSRIGKLNTITINAQQTTTTIYIFRIILLPFRFQRAKNWRAERRKHRNKDKKSKAINRAIGEERQREETASRIILFVSRVRLMRVRVFLIYSLRIAVPF